MQVKAVSSSSHAGDGKSLQALQADLVSKTTLFAWLVVEIEFGISSHSG